MHSTQSDGTRDVRLCLVDKVIDMDKLLILEIIEFMFRSALLFEVYTEVKKYILKYNNYSIYYHWSR